MSRPRRNLEQLREGLIRNLTLDFFDEEEISAVLAAIDSLDKRLFQKTLALCYTLSNPSSSSVPSFIARVRRVADALPLRDCERWITHAFDLLDAHGIDPFLRFVSATDDDSLKAFQSPGGLHLQSVLRPLETYLKGISGLDLKIIPDKEAYTDAAVVHLPASLNAFASREKNYLVYKFLAVFQWAQIDQKTLAPDMTKMPVLPGKDKRADLVSFFAQFPDQDLFTDLYTLLDAVRLKAFLRRELPGLMRDFEGVSDELFEKSPDIGGLPEKAALVEALYQMFLRGIAKCPTSGAVRSILDMVGSSGVPEDPCRSLTMLLCIRQMVENLSGVYDHACYPMLPAAIKPERVAGRMRVQRRARRKKAEAAINRLLNMPDAEHPKKPGQSLVGEKSVDPLKEYLVVKGRVIELDGEMRDIIEEKKDVMGGILVKGSDIGAATILTLSDLIEEEEVSEGGGEGIPYDEWDYRRGGYKKRWCSIREQDIHPSPEPFVETTLRKYGGYVTVLRKKFELLKKEPKILRRQRDGDDVDIDAVVDAFADRHAGLSPGDDLFTRLERQERSIAVLFLIDMSGSTKGWVNMAEKEALVLMCEALEALGDRYAIYGFSGMTRTRCDFYRIKGFEEAYADSVKARISGITPKDYTRMGPALRHSVEILKRAEARTRLLVTLSDGKPEDWDAYKGEYGIEDTRMALAEAKEKGIHSFCITIDREAGVYLPYMYGETAYTFIDDVSKLPNRITEIYRRLTT